MTGPPLKLRAKPEMSSKFVGKMDVGARIRVRQSEHLGDTIRVQVAFGRRTGWVTAMQPDGRTLLSVDADFDEHVQRYKDAHWKSALSELERREAQRRRVQDAYLRASSLPSRQPNPSPKQAPSPPSPPTPTPELPAASRSKVPSPPKPKVPPPPFHPPVVQFPNWQPETGPDVLGDGAPKQVPRQG